MIAKIDAHDLRFYFLIGVLTGALAFSPFAFALLHTSCESKIEPIYESKIIELNDSNTFEYVNVVDYLCDTNVFVRVIRSDRNSFYASTWRDGIIPHSTGKCMVKIQVN